MKSRLLALWAALALALLLSGCGKTALLTRLSEADANDALYTLLQGGVDADKRADAEAGTGFFQLHVPKSEQARALALLKANAQPSFKRPTLGELFARNQLISTPGEELIRYVYGIEQSLAQTLAQIDGVLVARVHINLPHKDPLARDSQPSSASVFIKHRAGQDLAKHVPAMQELVVRAIQGLSVEQVAVTLFPAAEKVATGLGPEVGPQAAAGEVLSLGSGNRTSTGPWLHLLLAASAGALLSWGLGRLRRTASTEIRPKRSSA